MRKISESMRLVIIIVLATLALHECVNGAAQRGEVSSELPDYCGQDQFYNQLEARCRNCSDVLQVFEPHHQQETQSNNRLQPATNGNQNNDATTIMINDSDQGHQSDQKAQEFMRLAQRLPQLNGNKSRSASPTGAPSTSFNRPRTRPTSAGASDAVLSRFVMKSATNDRESPTMAANDDSDLPLADGSSDSIDLLAATNNELSEATQRGDIRSAKLWQKVLNRFLQSDEFGLLSLPDSIQQCKQLQNLTACQMWSNVCVLSMYAHSSDNSANRRPSLSWPTSQLRTSSLTRADSRNVAELPELVTLRSSWQKCARFALTSICNSLREWHQFDKLQSQLELNSIFADEQEAASLAGETSSKVAPLSLVLQLNQPIQLLAYKYSLTGQLIEVNQFNLNDLRRSFCVGANNRLSLDDKLRFTENLNLFLDNNYLSLDKHQDQDELLGQLRLGQNVELSCKFSSLEANLFSASHVNETQFIDLFIAQPTSNGALSLKPVPVLIENLLFNQQLINLRYAQEPSRWKLVHRFFSQATLKMETRNSFDLEDELLIYTKGLKLELKFKRQQDKGLVLSSILLRLDYDFLPLIRSTLRRQLQQQTLLANDSGDSSTTKLNLDESFRKQLHGSQIQVGQTLSDMLMYKKDFDLLLTILCLISCIWSLIKTYNVQKFHGFIKLDIYSLFLFLIISCDIVANLMLIVTLLFGLHLFVSLKLHPLVMSVSQVPVFAPNGQLESTLLANLQLALVFKLVGLAYKLFIRLKADTFFIDWERPKMLTSTQLLNHQAASRNAADSKSNSNQMHQQQQVSFWRQYSIVNRWLQMQTIRRLDLTMQLLLFVFALQCFRLDHFATADANLHFHNSDLTQQNLTFRAVVMALVYSILATGQLAYRKLLHEPMIRSQMREFTDLCSVSNVSLISMLHPRFGYYIHGRNANGSSECAIGEMNALLEREERDLCSKRGLLPNTDQQTFILLLPKIINDHYRKLLFRTSEPTSGFLTDAPSALDGFQLKSVLNLSSLTGAAAASSLSPTARSHTNQRRSLIESIMARNRAANAFFINYLEHVYKDIDYSIRERKRFETACLLEAELEADDDEEAPIGLGNKPMAPRAAGQLVGGPLATINGRAGGGGLLAANQGGASQARARGLFFIDYNDSFTALLWLGLELDFIIMELLMLLNLDLWLGRANLIVTVGLLWLINRFFRMIYATCARNNLVVKAMLDDKFLNR